MTVSSSVRILLPYLLVLAGCADADPSDTGSRAQPDAPAHSPVAQAAVLAPMTLHKHPTCGCCSVWIEHMQQAGFRVAVRDSEDMATVKASAGVPDTMASCHTAHVGGYFIEGHVPASDVQRLLRERPDAKGLAVPGMPMGSPGMEHPDGLVQPYTVSLVLHDGSVREFSRHGEGGKGD